MKGEAASLRNGQDATSGIFDCLWSHGVVLDSKRENIDPTSHRSNVKGLPAILSIPHRSRMRV